jgi:hypothetical protein
MGISNLNSVVMIFHPQEKLSLAQEQRETTRGAYRVNQSLTCTPPLAARLDPRDAAAAYASRWWPWMATLGLSRSKDCAAKWQPRRRSRWT